jgi:ketosteroid isomerase-like protein
VSLYEATAVMVEKPGRIAQGEGEIRDSLRALIESGVQLTIGVTQVVQASDIAFVVSAWSVSRRADGARREIARGQGTDVMRRQGDGTWRFVIDNPYGAALGGSS